MDSEPATPVVRGSPRQIWPVLVGLVTVAATAVLSQTIYVREEHQLQQVIQIEALRARTDQRGDVEAAIQALNRLARVWERRRSHPAEELSFEAELEVTAHAHLQAIEWLDPGCSVRWVVPEERATKLTGVDLRSEPRHREALEAARAQDRVVVSRPMDLLMGGRGFLLIRPVRSADGLVGFLVGVMRFQELVASTLDEEFASRYTLSICEGGAVAYSSPGTDRRLEERWSQEVTLKILNAAWQLRVCPTGGTLAAVRSFLPELTMVVGFLLALMLCWIIHLARTARVRAELSESLNRHLSDQIAHRKKAESERDRFFALSNDMLGIVGLDGRFRQINPAWERVLGIPLGELMSRPVEELAHPDDGSPVIRAQAAGNGAEPVSFEGRFRTSAGEFKWLHWTMTVLRDESVCFAVAWDVSERRRWEGLLAHQVEELARSNAELEQFAYVASHDLQEPLRMVAIYTDLLASEYGDRFDERAHRYVDYVVEGATRMRSLVRDLLEFARVDGRSSPTVVDCEAALANALENLKAAFEQSGACIEHDPLPRVQGYPMYVTQLFQNLIGNAIKFRAQQPPRIQILASKGEDGWTVGVRDNGIGIDPRHAHRVFQIFERLHGRSRYPGNGIGLALCRKIVQLHRGRIWVESVPGQGSTFFFTLPGERAASP
ncbi:MAG: CHASE domain-containing protein [Candidatus Riflebacteria bacterium]|nr:CHASE domain-containing protein [Candidatus Riflebacteria bacterium]